MEGSGPSNRPCYSLRLMQPFLAVLREQGSMSPGVLDQLEQLRVDDRMPISVVHGMLRIATEVSGDPDLGLKAGRRLTLGDAGAMDYLWSSGATVREGIETASRSTRLVNDALTLQLEEDGDEARIVIVSRVGVPRAATDFMVAAMFTRHFRTWLHEALDVTTVSFVHDEPPSVEEYVRTFAPVIPRFSQPFVGVSFPRVLLDAKLPAADPKLHQVMNKAAEMLLAELPKAESFTERVRRLVEEELPAGNPKSTNIALRLGVGERTLARRLEQEGVTFKALLDSSRRELGTRLVGDSDVELGEIARRLGFSHAAAFHRAFRRWTGQTPMQYRSHRGRRLTARLG